MASAPMGSPSRGPGLLSSILIILIAAAITAGGVVALVAWDRGWGSPRSPEDIEKQLAQDDKQPKPAIVVPPFQLTDQYGAPVDLNLLKGKYWIADFGFIRCKAVCPAMTSGMRQVADALRLMPYWDRIAIVRFTVDPEHDTVEANREYFDNVVLAPYTDDEKKDIREHWFFLTGDKNALWKLSEEGFKLPVEDDADNPAMPITHSSKFVLVDPAGQIVDYYNGLDSKDRTKLLLEINARLDRTPEAQLEKFKEENQVADPGTPAPGSVPGNIPATPGSDSTDAAGAPANAPDTGSSVSATPKK